MKQKTSNDKTSAANTQRTKNKKKADDKKIDETIEQSFPASDPPGWYAGEDQKKK